MTRLTKPLLEAIASALNSALSGEGFDGGDFDGQNPEHFERAREWVEQELEAPFSEGEMTTDEQLPDAWLHDGEWARVGGFYIYPRDDQFHIGRQSGARDYHDVETGFANMQAAIDHARWMADGDKCSVPRGWICYGVDCGHSYSGGDPKCYYKYRCPTCGQHPSKCVKQ